MFIIRSYGLELATILSSKLEKKWTKWTLTIGVSAEVEKSTLNIAFSLLLQGPKLSIILIAIHFQFAFYYIRSILLEDLLIVIGALGSD